MNNNNPIVSVIMLTYKHELFLFNAINSVLNQICNFPFEIIIADDNSPDDTESIINLFKNHPRFNFIKYTKHSKNKGYMMNFIWSLENAKGKYISYCDGDDYWLDMDKLNSQVKIIENNKSISCLGGNIKIINNRNENNLNTADQVNKHYIYNQNKIVELRDIINKKLTIFHTSTHLFRRDLIDLKLYKKLFGFSISADIPLLFLLGLKGDLVYIDKVYSVQNMISEGVSNSNDHKGLNFILNRCLMWKNISNLNNNNLKKECVNISNEFRIKLKNKLINRNVSEQAILLKYSHNILFLFKLILDINLCKLKLKLCKHF
jgi:glycosyltransferase involved in cell wall biosynthesis